MTTFDDPVITSEEGVAIFQKTVEHLDDKLYEYIDPIKSRLDRIEENQTRTARRLDRIEQNQDRTARRLDRIEENQDRRLADINDKLADINSKLP